MKDTSKPARNTTAIEKASTGFTAEERAAMQERARELKAEARRGPRAKKDGADGEREVLAKIAEMAEPDRSMAERLHAIITFATKDLDGTFAQLQAGDAEVVQEPMMQPYGIRDCALRDPAGNLIRINEVS